MFKKLLSYLMSWENLTKILFFIFSRLIANLGFSHVSKKQKMAIQITHVINNTLGREWAHETSTDVDNDLVRYVDDMCQTYALKLGFKLCDIPPIE